MTTRDYTAEIVALQRARRDMQVAESTISAEVKARHRDLARQEIAQRVRDNKIEFARALKLAHEKGVPASLLRSDVLRTNSWDRWVFWRDLAEIEPDRVTVQNAKALKAAQARGYKVEGDTLTIFSGKTGTFDNPPTFTNIYAPTVTEVFSVLPKVYDAEHYPNAWADTLRIINEVRDTHFKGQK